jgi:hypothetical protein
MNYLRQILHTIIVCCLIYTPVIAGGAISDTVQFGNDLGETCDSYSDTPNFVNRYQGTSPVGETFTGTSAEIHYLTVYIGSGSGGTTTYVGLYDDNSGSPGVQLTYGSKVEAAGGWHKVPVINYTTSGATPYWIVFSRGSGNSIHAGCDVFGAAPESVNDFSQNNLPGDDNGSWASGSETGALGMFACGN